MDGHLSDSSIDQATRHPREYRLFWALDEANDGQITRQSFTRALERNGLTRKDPRLSGLYSALDALEGESLDFPAFLDVVQTVGVLIERMLQGDLALPDFAEFSAELERQYREVEQNTEGEQATYIPPLAEVNPEQFATAVMSIDGQLLELGKTETDFSIQSACKPFNYCFALEELGAEKVHQHIGMEPSGQAFNARVLMSDGTGRPHNPMINAGAIMTASLIQASRPLHRRVEHVRDMWARMTGGPIPRFNAWMAQEESRTGDNNRALGYMMKAAGVLLNGEDAVDHEIRDALEVYFSACSLEVNAREVATAAATLANNGVCPVTQERVLEEETVRNCLTMMQMCGMYDGSGQFCLNIGLPAKSGVGGAVFLVVPRLMGICVWSPRLDAIGNSVRGVDLAERLAQTYRLHLYDGVAIKGERSDPRIRAAQLRALLTSQALRAAGSGDVRTLQRLFDDGLTLEEGDYDRRTPLHLAAAEGQPEVVSFLLDHSVAPNALDRWGGTSLDDAELGSHTEVVELLRQHGAKSGDSKHTSSESDAVEHPERYGDVDAVVELLWAASDDDTEGLRRCLSHGIPVSAADYDNRTALHLAAADGSVDAVRYLLAHGHPIHVRDRWNATPLEEAQRENRDAVVELLSSAIKDFHQTILRADWASLARASDFVDRFTAAYGVGPLVTHRVKVVLDDVLSNIISRASDDDTGEQIALEFELGSDRLQIVVMDDGRAFDPLSEEPADTPADIEDIELRGLELKILRELTEDVSYHRSDGRNTLTLSFRTAAVDTL
jgi:glutaminase